MPFRYVPLLLVGLLCGMPVFGQSIVSQDADVLRVALASRLGEVDPERLAVENSVPLGRDGARALHIVQTLGRVPVRGTETVVAVDRFGTPQYVSGTLRHDLGQTPAQVPLLTAAAGRSAASRSGAALTTEAVYVEHDGALRLAWESLVPDGDHTWLVHIDARTGAEIGRRDLTLYDTWEAAPLVSTPSLRATPPRAARASGGDAYRVFAAPTASPLHTPAGPIVDGRTLAEAPANVQASPFGWHDDDGELGDEHDESLGNNVWAYSDSDSDNIYHPGDGALGVRTAGGLSFDFPLDLTASPGASRDAALTNAFYWANYTHDVLWHVGFDEASGNFQTHSYGRGGVGGDPMWVEILDRQSVNSATYSPRPDGSPPRIQLGEFTLTNPARDAAFDAPIIVHEYAHGLTTRLVGGGGSSCLSNEERMGEGWSDWYGLMLTMDADDARDDPRGIGAYVLGGEPGATFRPAPYSTSFALNDYTHARIREFSGPHGTGFVWATILWEATWDLIDAHGFDPDLHDGDGTAGNQVMLRLVTEAMKLTPCGPGFVDARNAILAADALLFPHAGQTQTGRHTELLWGAFQRRGLGGGAMQGDPDSRMDNVDSFGPPAGPGSAEIDTRPISLQVPNGVDVEHAVRIANRGVTEGGVLTILVSGGGPNGALPPWLSVHPGSLGLSAGEARNVLVRVQTEAMEGPGTYDALLVFRTNDALMPEVTVPVQVTVPPPPSGSVSIPTAPIVARLSVGASVERILTMSNTAPAGSSAVTVSVGAQPPGSGTGPWLSVSPVPSFQIAPGTEQVVTFTLGSAHLPPSRYSSVVRFYTDDAALPVAEVLLELEVGTMTVQQGDAGWRLVSFPFEGIEVRDVAEMNLVQGVEGFYPSATPNFVVGYDGMSGQSVATSQLLLPGTSVWWYLFDEDRDPGGASVSFALPHSVFTPWIEPHGSRTVSVTGTEGSVFALGNPYRAPLDIGRMPGDANGFPLRSTVFQMWDFEARTYETSLTQSAVPPWQGFLVELDAPTRYDIPESARSPSGVMRTPSTSPLIGFELAEADGPLRDRASVVRFMNEATPGRDRYDAAKLDPFGDVGITLSIVGRDGQLRAVESQPLPDSAAVVPLAVAARGGTGDLVLRWPYLEALPADWAVRLFDVVTGDSVDLLTESEYRFSVTPAAPRDPLSIGTRLHGSPTPRFNLLAGRASTFPDYGDLAPVLSLGTPYPNPSRGDARVRFSLAESGPARLTLIDPLGRELAVLVDDSREVGEHDLPLAASGLATGIYLLCLEAGGERLLTRVTITR